jgi:MFS family permease
MGVALGALFGGKIINSHGRRGTIIKSNYAIMVWSILSCVPFFYFVVVIRFLFGVTCGFLLAGAPKIVLETVPAHLLGFGFGSFANIFTFFFVSIVVMINQINHSIMTTHGFYILYLIPIPFTIIANIGLSKVEFESVTHIIENYNCKECDDIKSRCDTCIDHIKCVMHRGVHMNE